MKIAPQLNPAWLQRLLTPMPSESACTTGSRRSAEAAIMVEREVLDLNPNCCYNGCMGCTSLEKLRDFRGRWPNDWKHRLNGSARLRTEALRVM
jgi:hypothetical protein